MTVSAWCQTRCDRIHLDAALGKDQNQLEGDLVIELVGGEPVAGLRIVRVDVVDRVDQTWAVTVRSRAAAVAPAVDGWAVSTARHRTGRSRS